MHRNQETTAGALVRKAASACLEELPALADSYVAELRSLTGYSESNIPREELFRTAVSALKNMLVILSGSQESAGLRSVSENIGRRRAQQGVPLDSLLRAVRLDFPFLWRALGAHVGPESQATFVEDVVPIWDTVETHVSHVQSAYIAELADMQRELEVEQTYLLRRLLIDAVNDPTLRAHAAAELGLRLEGRYLVAAASPNHRQEFRPAVRAIDPLVRIQNLDGGEFVLFDEATLTVTHRRLLFQTPLGIAPFAVGMDQLPVMWKLATRLAKLDHRSDAVAATFADHWPQLPDGQFSEELRIISAAQFKDLFTLPESEADYLLETARHLMASGSVSRTAAELFCHRNTILNRLRRFTSLTNLDPTLPDDAGLIRLLLAARSNRE